MQKTSGIEWDQKRGSKNGIVISDMDNECITYGIPYFLGTFLLGVGGGLKSGGRTNKGGARDTYILLVKFVRCSFTLQLSIEDQGRTKFAFNNLEI